MAVKSSNIAPKKGFSVYTVIFLPLVIIFFIASVLMMKVISDVRSKEMKYSLHNLDSGSGSGRSIGLIARYRMIKKK